MMYGRLHRRELSVMVAAKELGEKEPLLQEFGEEFILTLYKA